MLLGLNPNSLGRWFLSWFKLPLWKFSIVILCFLELALALLLLFWCWVLECLELECYAEFSSTTGHKKCANNLFLDCVSVCWSWVGCSSWKFSLQVLLVWLSFRMLRTEFYTEFLSIKGHICDCANACESMFIVLLEFLSISVISLIEF